MNNLQIGFDALNEETQEMILDNIRELLYKEFPIKEFVAEGNPEKDYEKMIEQNIGWRLTQFEEEGGLKFSVNF